MAVRHNTPVGLTTLTLVEVLQGIRFDSRFQAARRHFKALPIFEAVSESLAIQSAANYRALRAKGITIRTTVDSIVATFCIEDGHLLLHSDVDFDYFERFLALQVVHP